MAILTQEELMTCLELSGSEIGPNGRKFLAQVGPMVEGALNRLLGFQTSQSTFIEYHPESPIPNAFDQEPLITGYEMFGGTAVARTWGMRSLSILQLRQLPVRSITSVYENISAFVGGTAAGDWPATTLLPATVYMFDQSEPGWSMTGQLVKTFSSWATVPRAVKVTYVAGLTANELATTYSPIKMAAQITFMDVYTRTMARSRAARVGGWVNGVHIEDFSVDVTPFIPGQNGASSSIIPADALILLSSFINVSRYFGR